jgi:enoyl-CoA hydratase/carnithine racemase
VSAEQRSLNVDFETLLYEERDGVAIVTMNRPEVHNAFNHQMQLDFHTLWRWLRTNDDVRCVILTGAGEKAFCTGIDRAESIERGYLDGEEREYEHTGLVSTPFQYNDPGIHINPKQNDLWKPVIAAVNGMACGGALYMLGEADIVIAAEHATFFDPHVTYGMVAGYESIHLFQKLPFGETMRLCLLGAHERMSAARAHQMGLVSEVVEKDHLLDRALWIGNAIASAPELAIQGTVRAVWLANEISRNAALSQASALVELGTRFENIESGQATFRQGRIEWQLR